MREIRAIGHSFLRRASAIRSGLVDGDGGASTAGWREAAVLPAAAGGTRDAAAPDLGGWQPCAGTRVAGGAPRLSSEGTAAGGGPVHSATASAGAAAPWQQWRAAGGSSGRCSAGADNVGDLPCAPRVPGHTHEPQGGGDGGPSEQPGHGHQRASRVANIPTQLRTDPRGTLTLLTPEQVEECTRDPNGSGRRNDGEGRTARDRAAGDAAGSWGSTRTPGTPGHAGAEQYSADRAAADGASGRPPYSTGAWRILP